MDRTWVKALDDRFVNLTLVESIYIEKVRQGGSPTGEQYKYYITASVRDDSFRLDRCLDLEVAKERLSSLMAEMKATITWPL